MSSNLDWYAILHNWPYSNQTYSVKSIWIWLQPLVQINQRYRWRHWRIFWKLLISLFTHGRIMEDNRECLSSNVDLNLSSSQVQRFSDSVCVSDLFGDIISQGHFCIRATPFPFLASQFPSIGPAHLWGYHNQTHQIFPVLPHIQNSCFL